MSWIQDILDPNARRWEEFYRNRWQHDAVVRSTHGVNCTGGCSWMVFVKDGLVTWELQATDYPMLRPDLPDYEPRGCQRGIAFSWYNYSPLRLKHPYLRGVLADLWARARDAHADPVEAWASIVEDEAARRSFQQARGKGGFRRAGWDECLELVAAAMLYTAKKYGPDRVAAFSPIPAMSMLSYAAGSRLVSLFGGTLLSFYDLYADFPPAFPEIWGEKTDVAESADWFNAALLVVAGSNLNMTRTPDVHFAAEARTRGTKLVVFSPDFSQVSRYADWWIPAQLGMDGAFWMAVDHVILKEFHADRQVSYFTDYLKRYSDAPFLVELERSGEGWRAGRFVRANRLAHYADAENGDWKLLVLDATSGEPRMPQGSIGFRWQQRPGQWNLHLRDGVDGKDIDPALTLLDRHEEVLHVDLPDYTGTIHRRGVPVRFVETMGGRVPVTTVLDLLMAQLGVSRGLPGDYPADYDDAEHPYTPAWQEPLTGISRELVVRFAREWAMTAERTRGRCMLVLGSGVNHWYHANLLYRGGATALMLCGCVGVNGGGLNHYTGQEKLAPAASWSALAMAGDWQAAPRLQNGPSFHYVHSDQWRYERQHADLHPTAGRFAAAHTLDHQAAAVRMGWLPFYPQFDDNPLELVRRAEQEGGARTDEQIVAWVLEELKARRVRFAVEDPDSPENWPRVFLIWRANALHASAKGHEYMLRHYLGTDSAAIADEALDQVESASARRTSPRGKMDLVVDVNFRLDTTGTYSDVLLPSATWYEKDDLNTTDLHSFIHPLGRAVPPSWESRTDWDIFRALAGQISALAPAHFPEPFRDLVTTPLGHDTPREIAQPTVRDWMRGECEAVPGKTMPVLTVVERDYPSLIHRLSCLGPRLREEGVEERGVHIPVADLYDEFVRLYPTYRWNGQSYPSLVEPVQAANALLFFAPETNGEVAFRGFAQQERKVGVPLVDLAEGIRQVRYDFLNLTQQPRRLLTSPCWSGIPAAGRPYAAFTQNVERLVPWRTLTGRQHFYIDHESYRAFGEALPTFKPRLNLTEAPELTQSLPDAGASLALACITPHGKWHIHTTYYDDLRMLSLSRGIEPLWINDGDAAELGVLDNDWVEALNDNGAVVTRAAVSARIPRGVCIFYHSPERTVGFPLSPSRGSRGGGTNSVTRMRLKPVLMAGGYAQLCYRFNDYGPPASDRDTTVLVKKVQGRPRWD